MTDPMTPPTPPAPHAQTLRKLAACYDVTEVLDGFAMTRRLALEAGADALDELAALRAREDAPDGTRAALVDALIRARLHVRNAIRQCDHDNIDNASDYAREAERVIDAALAASTAPAPKTERCKECGQPRHSPGDCYVIAPAPSDDGGRTDRENKVRKMHGELVELPRCPNCADSTVVRGTCMRCGWSAPIGLEVDGGPR